MVHRKGLKAFAFSIQWKQKLDESGIRHGRYYFWRDIVNLLTVFPI
jgi:hypothetical protein